MKLTPDLASKVYDVLVESIDEPPWLVIRYPEDRTPERLAAIARANARLAQLWEETCE